MRAANTRLVIVAHYVALGYQAGTQHCGVSLRSIELAGSGFQPIPSLRRSAAIRLSNPATIELPGCGRSPHCALSLTWIWGTSLSQTAGSVHGKTGAKRPEVDDWQPSFSTFNRACFFGSPLKSVNSEFPECFRGTLAAGSEVMQMNDQRLEGVPLLMRAAKARESVAQLIESCSDIRNETRSLLKLPDQILGESKAAAIARRSGALSRLGTDAGRHIRYADGSTFDL